MGPVLGSFKVDGINCTFLYHYNEKVQGLLYQFKGCKDYELRTIFLENFKFYLKLKYHDYVLIPAPSSKKGDAARGFNHVQEMFSILGLKMINCIHKTEDIKQADLTQKERENVGKYLKIDDVNLQNKKILLVDDVFTTGSTIRSMIKLVKSKHPKKIKCLLMCKTIDLDKR